MRIRYPVLGPDGVSAWQDGLRRLERDITYPLDAAGERFYIDHGSSYAAFYREMGRPARFLLATEGSQVLGLIAAAWKPVRYPDGRQSTAVYAGDFKVARSARGRGVAAGIFARGLLALMTQPSLWGADFAFGAAMRDQDGDVRRSFRRAHPGRLVWELARQRIYFADPVVLSSLSPGAPPVSSSGLVLSVQRPPLIVSTAGRKDLRVVSTGAPLPLCHLGPGPSEWGDLGVTLQRAGGMVLQDAVPGAQVCFGVDERLTDIIQWLSDAGLEPGGHATIIAIAGPRTRRLLQRAPWVHLSTAEI